MNPEHGSTIKHHCKAFGTLPQATRTAIKGSPIVARLSRKEALESKDLSAPDQGVAGVMVAAVGSLQAGTIKS